MKARPARAIVDALTPTPQSFASATGSEPANNSELSLYTLNTSIRAHFPPVKVIVADPPTENLHRIESLPHLQQVVLKVRRQRRRLRPTTTGLRSPTNRLLLQQGHHVADMSLLTGLTYNASRRVVVAQAGVSIVQLEELLHRYGLMLTSHAAPGVNARSVAAAFVTGTSGTLGRTESLFADGVHEVSLIDSSGQLRVFSSSVNPRLFSALRSSHTLFGIIYDITLRVFPSRRLTTISNCFTRLTSLLAHRGGALRNTVAMHGGVNVVWFPYNSARPEKQWTPRDDLVWVRMIDPQSKSKRSSALRSSAGNKSDDVLLPPPLLRFLSLPQWLTVHKFQLAKAGYTEFRREHALLFAADAFRESAWVLSAGRHIVRALDAAQSQYFDGNRSTRNVSVAFPTRIVHERARPAAVSRIANETADSGESSSELSSDSDDNLDLSDGDDAYYMHDAANSNDSSFSKNSDGWVSVYAAVLAVVRAVLSASRNGGEALAATTRLSIEITGESSALLAATRGSDVAYKCEGKDESDGRRRPCSFAILTMEAAMSAPGWENLANGVVRAWSKLRAARWVWDRHSVDIVMCALREDRDAHHVRRFLSTDRATEIAHLRLASGVDDIGMFIDEQLDNLMDGLFSKAGAVTADGPDSVSVLVSEKPYLPKAPLMTSEGSILCQKVEMREGYVEDADEGSTIEPIEDKKAPSLSPPGSGSETKSPTGDTSTPAEPTHMPCGQERHARDESQYRLHMALLVFVAFLIGMYTRDLAELAGTWFR